MSVLIFLGTWSTTKILKLRFALSRLAIDIVGIIVIAMALKKAMPDSELRELYTQAELMSCDDTTLSLLDFTIESRLALLNQRDNQSSSRTIRNPTIYSYLLLSVRFNLFADL